MTHDVYRRIDTCIFIGNEFIGYLYATVFLEWKNTKILCGRFLRPFVLASKKSQL